MTGAKPENDVDTYGLGREEANSNRGAGWWVRLRRQGHKIVRLFKDSIYGSPEASLEQAMAYRDAVISALPPATNHEQAVLLRKNNHSGISGVRRIETDDGEAWQATLMDIDGQKRATFSIARYGEEAAKSLAIVQRGKWLKGLPVKYLAYAHHAEVVAMQRFADRLVPVSDVFPVVNITDDEIKAQLKDINARFDALRPQRLRVRVKSYAEDRLSVSVSDAGYPARRKLFQLNRNQQSLEVVLTTANIRIEETITHFYNAGVAGWFRESHGNSLLDPSRFDPCEGFNVLVFVPGELITGK